MLRHSLLAYSRLFGKYDHALFLSDGGNVGRSFLRSPGIRGVRWNSSLSLCLELRSGSTKVIINRRFGCRGRFLFERS